MKIFIVLCLLVAFLGLLATGKYLPFVISTDSFENQPEVNIMMFFMIFLRLIPRIFQLDL